MRDWRIHDDEPEADDEVATGVSPGKCTLTAGILMRRAVQRSAGGDGSHGGGHNPEGDEHEAAKLAAEGVAGSGGPLPHLDQIQRSFGRHDVTGVAAHAGGAAAHAAGALGAEAYAFGNAVAFAGTPSLHTAAHEAAHAVQQRDGVSVPGGVGQDGERRPGLPCGSRPTWA